MKVLTILGARPQFIKAGTVSREIIRSKAQGYNIKEVIVHTGQHFDENMSDIFFKEMKIPKPNYNLGVNSKDHGAMTGLMLEKIEEILCFEKPDWVVLYGDTNSTLSGALAASKLNIKIAHIESGLRSFNMAMPEEINRIITDRLSTFLFCPTTKSVENLNLEGVSDWGHNPKVMLTGDVMQDGAIFYKKISEKPKSIDIDSGFVLCTVHRAENTDNIDHLKEIFSALKKISHSKEVVMPLHPRTKKIIEKNKIDLSGIRIIEPVGYLNMVWLIDNSSLILTDSGGLQKEAYFFNTPCITLRNETEWVELVECGANILTGANKEAILQAFEKISEGLNIFEYDSALYGDGTASEIIVRALRDSNEI